MATADPRFPTDLVRTQLKFAMNMGAANDATTRCTFRWTAHRTYGGADPAGVPYDLDAAPATTVSATEVVIDCAVAFQPNPKQTKETAVGEFNPSYAVITVLDVDYVKIVDAQLGLADQVTFGNDVYNIQFEAPVIGLFDMDVHTIYYQTQDES